MPDRMHGTQLSESPNARVRNIVKCDMLMIDEISMISEKMLK